MALRFYNTLSQQVEEFQPARDNTVRRYTCGPAVCDFAHIGNFRTFTFVDIVRRWLSASGFRLDHVTIVLAVENGWRWRGAVLRLLQPPSFDSGVR